MTLPVFQVYGQGFAALWRHRFLLARFAAFPAILLFVVMLGFERLVAIFPAFARGIESLGALSLGLAIVPFVVQSYRLFLLGDKDKSCGSWYWAGSGYREILGLTVVVWALIEAPAYVFVGDIYDDLFDILADEASAGRYGAVASSLAIMALLTFVWIRLVFLYPVLSLGQGWDLAARWRETRGCFWRLLIVLILTTFSVSVVLLVLTLALTLIWSLAMPDAGPGVEFSAEAGEFSLLDSVLLALVSVPGAIVVSAATAAVVSVCYARLTGFPAKGLEAEPA